MTSNHWGFTQPVFQKEIAVADLFQSSQFTELTARLQVMVEERLLGVVTGEIGAGKSSAVRYLAAQLDPRRYPLCYVADSHLTPYDFYQTALDAWGVTAPFHRPQARRQFVTLMLDLYQHQHKTPVLIIDEAQGLPAGMLQELRYVLNTGMDALTPFTCILVGQPDLRATLRLKIFEAIHQRVGLRFHLRGLTEADTAAYVTHQCRRAGVDRVLFTPSALTLLAAQSRGLPRVINHLATAALWDAESQGAPVVEEAHVQHAVRDWRDDG
ncbi:MAG: AAA family ATPase [Thermaerobacter sp.]|nr:AAA family ATPase [Thermaerobacter sp.]